MGGGGGIEPLCLNRIRSLITREHWTDPQSTDRRERWKKQREKKSIQADI